MVFLPGQGMGQIVIRRREGVKGGLWRLKVLQEEAPLPLPIRLIRLLPLPAGGFGVVLLFPLRHVEGGFRYMRPC